MSSWLVTINLASCWCQAPKISPMKLRCFHRFLTQRFSWLKNRDVCHHGPKKYREGSIFHPHKHTDIFAVQKGVSLPPTSGNKILEAWGIFPRDDIPTAEKITWKKHGWFFTKPFSKYDRQNAKWLHLPPRFGVKIPNIFELPAPTWNPNDLYFLKVNPPKNKAFSNENKVIKGFQAR